VGDYRNLEDPVDKRLRALCANWLSYGEKKAFPGGCVFSAASLDFDDRPGRVRDRIVELTKKWLGNLGHAVRDAQFAGESRKKWMCTSWHSKFRPWRWEQTGARACSGIKTFSVWSGLDSAADRSSHWDSAIEAMMRIGLRLLAGVIAWSILVLAVHSTRAQTNPS